MSKKDSLNVVPTLGRGIAGNLAVTGQYIKTAIKSGVTKLKGQK